MATVTKTAVGKPATAAKVVPSAIPAGLSLPTTLSKAVNDINEYNGMIIGEPGIGKTTLALQEPGVLLLTFDPYQKSLEILQKHVKDWKEFYGYLLLLEQTAAKGNFPYSRIIVDGCDLWFRACQKWVCEKLKIEHPADEPWAKGWDLLASTFSGSIDRLLRLPCGTWFIAHNKMKEVETRAGTKQEKLVAALGQRADETIVGRVDLLLNIHYIGASRVATIRGSDEFEAKCRIDQHFLTPAQVQVTDIVLGNKGPAEAWSRLLKAFNNQQTYSTYAEYLAMLKKGATPTPKK